MIDFTLIEQLPEVPEAYSAQYLHYFENNTSKTPPRTLATAFIPIFYTLKMPIYFFSSIQHSMSSTSDRDRLLTNLLSHAQNLPATTIHTVCLPSNRGQLLGLTVSNADVKNLFKQNGWTHNQMLDSLFAMKGSSRTLFKKDNHLFLVCDYDHGYSDAEIIKLASLIPYILNKKAEDMPEIIGKLISAMGSGHSLNFMAAYMEWYDSVKDNLLDGYLSLIGKSLKDIRENNTSEYEKETDMARSKIVSCSQELERATERYNVAARNLQVYLLSAKDQSAVDELVEYIRKFKKDTLISATQPDPDKLRLSIQTPASFFSSEDMEQLLGADRSNIYNRHAHTKALCKALFVDQDYRIMLAATFNIKLASALGLSAIKTGTPSIQSAMYNGHINSYACLGQNSGRILEALRSNNLIMAYEAMLATTSGLTFPDTAAMGPLIKQLTDLDSNVKCIITPTGDRITIADLWRILQHEANQTQQETPTQPAEGAVELELVDLN